jgi:hypothetical protein
VGSERVVIGRRSVADSKSLASSLGISGFVVEAGVTAWLLSPALAVCAFGVVLYAVSLVRPPHIVAEPVEQGV